MNPGLLDAAPIGELTTLTSLRLLGFSGDQLAKAYTGRSRKLASAYLGYCTLTPEANRAIFAQTRLKAIGFTQVHGLDASAESWAALNELTSLQMNGGELADLGFLSKYVTTTVVKLTDVRVGTSQTFVQEILTSIFFI